MEPTESSEKSAALKLTPGIYPKEDIQRLNYSLRKWKRKCTNLVEEYCWAKTAILRSVRFQGLGAWISTELPCILTKHIVKCNPRKIRWASLFPWRNDCEEREVRVFPNMWFISTTSAQYNDLLYSQYPVHTRPFIASEVFYPTSRFGKF
jgi:hypothetical protein